MHDRLSDFYIKSSSSPLWNPTEVFPRLHCAVTLQRFLQVTAAEKPIKPHLMQLPTYPPVYAEDFVNTLCQSQKVDKTLSNITSWESTSQLGLVSGQNQTTNLSKKYSCNFELMHASLKGCTSHPAVGAAFGSACQ